MNNINDVVIYTDTDSYWLIRGLIDTAKKIGCRVSQTILDELESEDRIDIQHSFSMLDQGTLLLGCFSDKNQSIDEINYLFPPLSAPYGFNGFSLVILQDFPKQFYGRFLQQDFDEVRNLSRNFQTQFQQDDNIKLENTAGNSLEFLLKTNIELFPFTTNELNRHILFPSYEIISEIVPESVNGILIIDGSISAYLQEEELIDAFGPVDKEISLEFEDGLLVNVEGFGHMGRRLRYILNDLSVDMQKLTKLGIGVGPLYHATGIIEFDRQLQNMLSFGFGDRSIELTTSQYKILKS